MIWFGPAGSDEGFAAKGYKSSLDVPLYLSEMGLNAYEYQCGRGVRVSEKTATELGARAREKQIRLSLHAPYFISMSSVEAEKRDNSINYIMQSATAAKQMGASRIIVHTGSCGKISREEALALAMETMKKSIAALDEAGLGDIHICPETMGKINQLGTLDEVLTLCTLDERLIPCVDFGHLNARTQGGVNSYDTMKHVFDAMENILGNERMRKLHIHFSKIEYTKGGEKRHLTFADTQYGPEFGPLAQLLYERDCEPVVICESAGTQAGDAVQMKELYETVRSEVEAK